MSERRYTEEEVAQIFERATEAQKASLPAPKPAEGTTLRELQEIGREVGLPAELVARAAKSLEMQPQTQGRKLLGLPVGVGRSVELGRTLTDAEWHRLVADLRETFDARGRLSEQGPFKQWTNGNLQALLEPTATGQRLRLKTLKGSAMGAVTAGSIGLAVMVFLLADEVMSGSLPADRIANVVMLVAIVALVVGGNLLHLPRWARERARQMEAVIERLSATLYSQGTSDGSDERR
jgi:hypothetical protein